MQEPLSVEKKVGLGFGRFFLRSVTRQNRWRVPAEAGDPQRAAAVFREEDGQMSLWLVRSDNEFRRAVLAMNEHRTLRTQFVDLLPIQCADLRSAGIRVRQTNGDTECTVARGLHFDAAINQESCIALAAELIAQKRKPFRCSEKELQACIEMSTADECLAIVPEVGICQACGGIRSP